MISKHTCRWSDKQRVPRFVSIKFLIKSIYHFCLFFFCIFGNFRSFICLLHRSSAFAASVLNQEKKDDFFFFQKFYFKRNIP